MMPQYKKRTSKNSLCEEASSAHRQNMLHDDWIKSYSWCFFSTLLEKNMKEYICKIEWFPQKELVRATTPRTWWPSNSFVSKRPVLPNPWRKRPLAGNNFPPRPWRGWCELPAGLVSRDVSHNQKNGWTNSEFKDSALKRRVELKRCHWASQNPKRHRDLLGQTKFFPIWCPLQSFVGCHPLKFQLKGREILVWSMDLCGVASKKALFTWKEIGRSSSFRVRPCFKAKKRPKQAWEGVIESEVWLSGSWVVHIWGSWCLYCSGWG